MSGVVIGIDPGKKGGLVALSRQGEVVWSGATDVRWVLGKEYDVQRMWSDLADVKLESGGVSGVVLERQWSRPTDGKRASFSTGFGYGLWMGLIMSMGVRLLTPAPTTWQTIRKGVPGKGKEQSILCARQQLPGLELLWGRRQKPHDGLADAGCLALWGLREWSG